MKVLSAFMGVKIAVIGTHCTGKTKLCSQLRDYLKSKGHKVDFVSEVVRGCPHPVNEKTSIKAQEWVILKQIEEENKKKDSDFLVCDRSVFDTYAYLYKVLNNDHKELFSYVLEHLKTYDVLFLTEIDESVDLKEDGFRSTDPQFRRDVDRIINNKLEVLKPYFDAHNIKVVKISSFEDIKKFIDSNY